jgi:guanylate kinase
MLRRAPERTADERRNALEEANRVRFARAATKRDLKSGRLGIYELLMDPSEELKGAKVEEMLLAVKGMGRIKVTRVMREAGISRSKTLVGLTHGPEGSSDRGSRVRGRLIVVSGPSGAGKSTLIRAALDAVPELAYSVSATTRDPRPGEVDGRDYVFLTREEFERWIEEDRFLEWAQYSGNLYGTPEQKVEEFLDEGRSVILEIELQGARQVRRKRPDAAMVFVRAPSLDETRRRLRAGLRRPRRPWRPGWPPP